MSKIYTPEFLLRYIYKETSEQETAEMNNLLRTDANLSKELNELTEAVSVLEEVELNAHPTSIRIIMEHSQKMHEVHH